MCGIIGIFNDNDEKGKVNSKVKSKVKSKIKSKVELALKMLQSRGNDGNNSLEVSGGVMGHTLHAIVGHVKQPLVKKGVLTSNCEIYNWKDLEKKEGVSAKNDSDLLLQLLDKKGADALDVLDGVYSFGYLKDDTLILARDLIGVKPLWYSHGETFAFCSEKKVLESLGYAPIFELNPRQYLKYDVKTNKLNFFERKYFETSPLLDEPEKDIVEELAKLIEKSVKKRIANPKIGVLFSGGVDSTLIVVLLKKLGVQVVCYTTAVDIPNQKDSQDMKYAIKASEDHGLELKKIVLTVSDIKKSLKRIVPLIEDTNVVKVGVALTLDAACKAASDDGCKIVFSGLGSEELFAGYQRHRDSGDLNQECLAGLRKIYERDTYRDDVVSMSHSVELRLPFLDKELTQFSLRIDPSLKIKDGVEKYILRKAAEKFGVSKDIAWRKKKAAQYGSNVHKALIKLAKHEKYARLSEYMNQFYPSRQVRLVSLLSSGKDSHYATYIMSKQNYDIRCVLSLVSENEFSYMFHTPNIHMVELQAEAMNLPLITQKTKGEKEAELSDLEEGLKKAISKYKVEGVVTGALYSTYQRNRIEKICDKLGLKVFSPLWHIDQYTEVHQLLSEGFEVVLSSVACDGLDKSWVGKRLTFANLEKLSELNKKIGINIAGEGGEYESLVLDSPMFEKKIVVDKSSVRAESEHNAFFDIEKAELVSK